MDSYELSDSASLETRDHPWTEAEGNPEHRYYDLKGNPALIRTSLEDFVPWAAWSSTETFYRLLEWLNTADSLLESNDCEFTGPERNENAAVAKTLQVSGRMMVLWRHLPINLSRQKMEWLKDGIHQRVAGLDADFHGGALGTSVVRTRYVSLPLPEEHQQGFQLMLSFWSWGDSEVEVMTNLDRTLRNIREALGAVLREVEDSIEARRALHQQS